MDTYNAGIQVFNVENYESAVKRKAVQTVTSRKPFGARALNCNTPANVTGSKKNGELLGDSSFLTPKSCVSQQKFSPNCLSVCKSNSNIINKKSPLLNEKKKLKSPSPSKAYELNVDIEDYDISTYLEDKEVEDIFKFSKVWENADVIEFLKNYTKGIRTPPPNVNIAEDPVLQLEPIDNRIDSQNPFWPSIQYDITLFDVDLPVY